MKRRPKRPRFNGIQTGGNPLVIFPEIIEVPLPRYRPEDFFDGRYLDGVGLDRGMRFRLTEADEDDLHDICAALGMTKSHFARQVVCSAVAYLKAKQRKLDER